MNRYKNTINYRNIKRKRSQTDRIRYCVDKITEFLVNTEKYAEMDEHRFVLLEVRKILEATIRPQGQKSN